MTYAIACQQRQTQTSAAKPSLLADPAVDSLTTALACIAVLDGVPSSAAVAFVRAHYDPRAVETPWQRRFVTRFRPDPGQAPEPCVPDRRGD